nr:integrase, catalytic region, zinc finger, CCHC-type, peptidase aspartic, catalytic [Tanacetum cinerariifolium]
MIGLRFVKDLAFFLRSTAFCLLQRSCVFPQKHCILSTLKILHFASETLRFVYFKDLAFYLRSTAFCLLPRSCVLPQKHCVLSTSKILRFALEALPGLRDRPLMLATGRYPQWRSRFLRYIDTRTNGDALRKCILSGPYKPTTVLVQAVAATDDSPAIPKHTTEMWEAIERLQQGESLNIQDVKTNLFWEFGKFTSHDEETMELYYIRFHKLMNEMIRNNLTVATMQVNVQFLQQLQPEWSRFVTIVKQQHKLDKVSYHKLFDILKQYQKEVNEIRAERLAGNANPLALVTTAQANQDPYYQTSKSHKSYAPSSKPSIPPRSHTTTRNKGKEIAKPITPPFESASKEDNDLEHAPRDKDMQKNLALIAKYFKKIYKPTNKNIRTSSNSKNKNVDTTPRYKNDNQSRQFRNQWTMNFAGAGKNVGKSQKRVKDSTYHKEKMLLCKQAEKGVPLQAEQYDWLADTDEEIDEQESKAHYSYMTKIQEVPTTNTCIDSEPLEQGQNDTGYNVFANELQHSEQSESISNTCLVETDDSNVIPDSLDMCDDVIQNDQNDVESDDKLVALANLIDNLKLDVDEKKIQKQLKKANTTLAQELKECKTILAETSKTLGESNSVRDSCLVALQNKQTKFEKYKAFNDRTVDYDKLKRKLNETLGQLDQKDIEIKEGLKTKAYEILVVKEKHDELIKQSLLTKSHYEGLVKQKTKDIEILIQTCLIPLALKTQNDSFIFVHELKQEMYDDLNSTTKCSTDSKTIILGKLAPFSNSFERRYFSKTESVPKLMCQKVYQNQSLHRLDLKQQGKLTLNVNAVCATCKKCLVDSDHFACVTQMLNDVNARTKKPNVVPISARKPKGQANKSVANPHNKKVALKSTTQKPKSYYRMLYEKTSKAWKWWIEKQCPSGYKWVSKTKIQWVPKARNSNLQKRIVQLIIFIADSGCMNHMTGNLKLLCNFVKKFLGTVRFGNDQFASILGYGDLVQGNITISRVYCVEGLNRNLFSVGQFCDADLEVAFRKSTCFVRDLQGNDLLTEDLDLSFQHGRPDGQDQVWKSQRSVHGQAKTQAEHLEGCSAINFLSFRENLAFSWVLIIKVITSLIHVINIFLIIALNGGFGVNIGDNNFFMLCSLFFNNSLENNSRDFPEHMTCNLKLLCNFVEKFLGTVHFGNDQFVLILGYGDLVQGNVTINRVYYVEGLNHNLFSVGQFCDADLEVAFRKSTCFVRDLHGHTNSSMVIASKTFSSQLRLHQLAFKEGYCDWSAKVEIRQGSTIFIL